MKSNIVKLIYFVFTASLFTNCHEDQARAGYKEGNIIGRWEWIRSEVTFVLPGTVLLYLRPKAKSKPKLTFFSLIAPFSSW